MTRQTRQTFGKDVDYKWLLTTAWSALEEALFLLDDEGRIAFACGAVEALFGQPPENLARTHIRALMADHDFWRFEDLGDQYDHPFAAQTNARRADGSLFPVGVTVARLANNRTNRYVVAVRDMGGLVEMQHAAISRTEQLSTLTRVSNLVAEGGDFIALMEKLLLITMQSLNIHAACLHQLDRRTGKLVLLAHRGVSREIIARARELPADPSWLQDPLVDANTLRLADWPELDAESLATLRRHHLDAANVAVLVSKDQIFGTLIYLPMSTLAADAAALFDAVVRQIALAMEKHHLLTELQESQRKYSAVIEWANDGIMIAQDEVFKFVNKRLADLLEFNVSDMVGMPIERIMFPDDEHGLREQYRKRVSGEVPKEIYQSRLRTRGGKEVRVEFNATTIEFDGHPASLSFVRDLTERIQLQQQLTIEKQTAEFYNDVLTHDVNNLLHTVIGNLELLADPIAADSPERVEHHRTKAIANARRCSQLVDQVRKLMTIRHLDPSSFVPLPLTQMLQEAQEVVREQFRGTRFTAEIDAQKNQYVLGHRLAGQIFINLFSNAIRHNDNDAKRLWVDVREADDGAMWAIGVADNGNGIPDDVKQKIYERFSRFSPKGGLGLGMSIVKALVEVMHGRIVVTDRVAGQPAQGVRVVVYLRKA